MIAVQAFIQLAPKSAQIQEKYQGLVFSGLWGHPSPCGASNPSMWVPAICPWFALVHYKEETLSLLIQSSSVLSPKKLSFCQLVFVFRVQVLIRFNLFQENISTNDLQRKFLRCSLGHHSCSIDLPALESNYILYSNPTYPVAIQKVVIFYTRIQDILLQFQDCRSDRLLSHFILLRFFVSLYFSEFIAKIHQPTTFPQK